MSVGSTSMNKPVNKNDTMNKPSYEEDFKV